jgi:hypothetical protein
MSKKIAITLYLVTLCLLSIAQRLTMSEFVVTSTIKIETITKVVKNGRIQQYRNTGTGFFFEYASRTGGYPVIVTNKHVIKDADSATLYFHRTPVNGDPDYEHIEKVTFNHHFKNEWILHPDSNIDLAVMPIGSLLHRYEAAGKPLGHSSYTESNIPNQAMEHQISAIEDILMIGYPFGLRDLSNDIPIVRKGITATPPFLDYNGNAEFLCDVPVYSGSSGSPIIIFDPASYSDRFGNTFISSRLLILGINYATYQKDFKGKLIPSEQLNVLDSFAVSVPIPYNIAIVIKAKKLLEFRQLLGL